MAPGVELGDLNWLAIGLGVAANMILGFLWYSAKSPTGRIWMKGTGQRMDAKPAAAQMVRAMILMVVGAFLMAFVFAHGFVAYDDAYLKDDASWGIR